MCVPKTDYSLVEEKIPVQVFHTSEHLKDEIGQRILNRSKKDWVFVDLSSRGPFIYLKFKQKEN